MKLNLGLCLIILIANTLTLYDSRSSKIQIKPRLTASSRQELMPEVNSKTFPRNLIEWVKMNGGTVSNSISISPNPDEGLASSGLINAHTSGLISFPSSLLIARENKSMSNICLQIENLKDSRITSILHVCRAVWLYFQSKDSSSHYKTYLDSLPKKLPNIPIFYSQEDLELVTGSMLEKTIQIRKRKLTREFNAIKVNN